MGSEIWTSAVSSEERERSSQPTASALTADGNALWVDADRLALLVHPPKSGIAVLQARGEGILRGESILHGHHNGVDLGSEAGARVVNGGRGADHEGAAVDVQQCPDVAMRCPSGV